MVIKGKVDKSAFKDAFKARNIDASTDVQKFLDQMVGDNQGYEYYIQYKTFFSRA